MKKTRYERPVIKRIEHNMPNKLGVTAQPFPKTHIDGVAVKTLIRDYGSPLFVLSEKTIRRNFKKARKAFKMRYPKVQFTWLYKTNYLNAVCNIYHQEASWPEVVSGFEYDKAINNGVSGKKIIFNRPDKTTDALAKGIKNESLIHIDHLDELYTILELTETIDKRPRVANQVNMDTGIYPIWDRHGFNYENGQAWDALNKIMASGKMDCLGLHCHIGTFMLSS